MTHKKKPKELTNDIIDPEILEAIKQKANEGNIQASKLLMEYKKLKNTRGLSGELRGVLKGMLIDS